MLARFQFDTLRGQLAQYELIVTGQRLASPYQLSRLTRLNGHYPPMQLRATIPLEAAAKRRGGSTPSFSLDATECFCGSASSGLRRSGRSNKNSGTTT